jgi:thioredoxin 1
MSDVVRCPSCGQANRIPEVGSGETAVCGRCKTPLASGPDPERSEGEGSPSQERGRSFAASAAQDQDGHPVELSDKNFKSTIGSGKSVVDFWAPWCGPCRMIAPVLEQLATERRDIRFGKLNVDENPQTSAAFGVHGIPLLVFFKDGAERGRVVGAVPKGQIEAAIRQYLG